MHKEISKERIEQYVEVNKKKILEIERFLWKHPEVGYKEWVSSSYLEQEYEKLGYKIKKAGDIPGFVAELDTHKEGPTIAFMAELDALFCESHPDANPETKAVHACCHHGQQAGVYGCAAALIQPGAIDGLCGKIKFIAVPAEETIDLEYRQSLIQQGKIHYVAGKTEFLYRGLLDDIDLVVLIHPDTKTEKLFEILDGSNGCITKHYEYQGVASHAAIDPDKGVNALYAAMVGITACNSLRETFVEKDCIRFHPIITQAGVAANAIPDIAKLDTYVRANEFHKMIEMNKKMNCAIAASAAALGANVRISDTIGNMPLNADKKLNQVFADAVTFMFGENQIYYGGWDPGSTDLGDLSTLIPAIQPQVIGATGTIHGQDLQLSDPEKACVNPAKVMVAMAHMLLADDAKCGREIIDNYCPVFKSKEEYFKAVDQISCDYLAVEYRNDKEIVLHT